MEKKISLFNLKDINATWTLFIDRDGVLNHEKKDDYILNWQEFHFYDGAVEAMKLLANQFFKIVLVTNQRGVGKGLMTEMDLQEIHRNLKQTIEKAKGRLDAIYTCFSVDDAHADRKPNPGMAFKAQRDFPQIDFSKSIMIGNKLSDMEFGRNAGMRTVFLATTHPETAFPHAYIDRRFSSLLEFAKAL